MSHKKPSFAAALRTIRKVRGLSQEAFSEVSSRTYLSSLERGLKSPTLTKITDLAEVMGVHPATLLVLASAGDRKGTAKVLARVQDELNEILESRDS
jgi:transcriptional regulator with XRE-family HTH domain